MVIQLYPPYKLIPLSISGKLTLPQEILEVSSDSRLFFRREKDAMQVQYTIQVATDFSQYFFDCKYFTTSCCSRSTHLEISILPNR